MNKWARILLPFWFASQITHANTLVALDLAGHHGPVTHFEIELTTKAVVLNGTAVSSHVVLQFKMNCTYFYIRLQSPNPSVRREYSRTPCKVPVAAKLHQGAWSLITQSNSWTVFVGLKAFRTFDHFEWARTSPRAFFEFLPGENLNF